MPLKIYKAEEKAATSLFSWSKSSLEALKSLPDGSLSLNQFLFGRFMFRDSVEHRTPATGWADPCIIDAADLISKAPIATPGNIVYLTVYHGVNGGALVRGVRFILVSASSGDFTPQLDTTAGDHPAYVIDKDGKLVVAPDATTWRGYQNNYYADVSIRRIGRAGDLTLMDRNKDPKAISFPFQEEIVALWEENRRLSTGEFQLVMSDYCHFHAPPFNHFAGEDGFRHGVCFHVRNKTSPGSPYEDMLRNGDQVSVYAYAAADLGYLCPPRCKKNV